MSFFFVCVGRFGIRVNRVIRKWKCLSVKATPANLNALVTACLYVPWAIRAND